MKIGQIASGVVTLALLTTFFASNVNAASAGSLLEAKKEAEAKGYTFITSRDEIIAKAKKEGRVRVLSSLDPDSFKPMMDSFRKKYPSIEIRIDDLTGTEGYQRFLLELNAGTVKDFDTAEAGSDFYNESAAHALKFDILGMAQHGVLTINPKMVDPNYRNFVTVATTACAIAYNKDRVSPEKLPQKWEDFLKPEFKGRKFVADVRPQCMASMIAGMGEEWVLNYARKIKDQEPIWVRGNARVLTAIDIGDQAMHQMTFWNSCMRQARKNPGKSLQCKIVEPVPVYWRETQYVIKPSPHPHAALLLIEHMASREGQQVIDENEPVKSFLYADGEIAKLVKGKKVIVNDYKTFQNTPKWMKMVVEAYGFPRAEKIK
jgi:iron(III) transport system substrate-binding protein